MRIGKFDLNPPQLILGGFAGTIILGALLLVLPWVTPTGKSIGFINALFTSTSAVCVTGLIVLDTAKDFNQFGQIIILLLIQIGGLGIMTLTTMFALALGRRITLSGRLLLKDALGTLDTGGIIRLLNYIIKMTLIAEIFGTLVLTLRFYHYHHFSLEKAVYVSVFHSISAFCNAGFSVFSDSLMKYTDDPIINLTVMTLIILGGLGFVVLYNLTELSHLKEKKTVRRLSVQSKLVIVFSAALILIPALFFLLIELNNGFTGNITTKIMQALFQSVTTRTAGFNTVDISSLTNAVLFFMIILMTIGASPGGTGGGIKTTTVYIIYAAFRSILKNRPSVEISERKIPSETVQKAVAVFFMYLGFLLLFFTLLLISERDNGFSFIEMLFEITSAQGTVGLSMGITSMLSAVGKLIIVLTMFIGRTGPLTLAMAIGGLSKPEGDYEYPEEGIMIG